MPNIEDAFKKVLKESPSKYLELFAKYAQYFVPKKTENEVKGELTTNFDFNDAISGGLRRRTDTVRAVLERTRGDVTTSLRQADLEQALEALEQRIRERSNQG